MSFRTTHYNYCMQVVASERRYKEEIELLKAKVVQQKKEFDRKREHLKEDMLRRQKQVLDDNKQLQNNLASKKEEAEVCPACHVLCVKV